ncbi:MAG: 3-deoxy-manno-octulosonate cytidylyltransferase [bacterium]|nr:3-deoxy-manno-octulosonate cytidylyltransferase [bacterium]
MKILGVIPARYGAIRFPGKPLADICGKPMVLHVYDRAKQAKSLTDLVVATDDTRIFSVVEQAGGKAIMTSSEHQSGTDRLGEVASKLDVDIIVNVQGDEPLLEPKMIDEAVQPLLDDKTVLMATLKKRIADPEDLHNPNIVKVVCDKDGFALYFSRSLIPYPKTGWKDASIHGLTEGELAFYKHIGLYVYRKELLLQFTKLSVSTLEKIEGLEQLRVLDNGYKIKVVETQFDTIAVDTPEDLERVKQIVGSR